MKTLKKVLISSALTFGILASITPQMLFAHCQVPCGIYDDNARIHSMLEDSKTVSKATTLINKLAGKSDAQSQNQMARWVMNKEKHAESIINTISNYFLTQRVKTTQKDYAERLAKHHTVIVSAMKVKQNTDMKHVKKLQKSIEALAPYYVKKKHP